MRASPISLVAALAAASVSAATAPDAFAGEAAVDPVVYTRADVERATAGRIEWRRAWAVRLMLPAHRSLEPHESFDMAAWRSCIAEPGCSVAQVYGQSHRLDFFLDRVEQDASGGTRSSVEELGRIAVAADLAPGDEDELEEVLEARLRGLGSPAFDDPFAGMGRDHRAPWQEFHRRSQRPWWFCTEVGGAVDFSARSVHERGGYTTSPPTPESAARICEALGSALDAVEPVVFRTLPNVLAQVRHSVRRRAVSTFGDLTWTDRLAPLPSGVVFRKRALDEGELTGAIREGFASGVYRGREGRIAGVEREVEIERNVSLELLGAPMWTARWTFERESETFGRDGVLRTDPPRTIEVAVVPFADPLHEARPGFERSLDVPERALLETAAALYRGGGTPGPEAIEQALAQYDLWPANGDWMVVGCYADGTAWFGVAPFGLVARVTNAGETCAAIRRELDG